MRSMRRNRLPRLPHYIRDLAAVEQVIELNPGRTQEHGRLLHGELLMQVIDRSRAAGRSKGSLKRADSCR